MNFMHIAGHLGADPEVRFTSSGKKVTNLRVAVKVRKGQNDDTVWYRVTIWGEQYDKMIPYLKKGSAVMVAGELHKPEIFTDRDGKPQISMEITVSFLQFSPFGKGGTGSGQSHEGAVPQGQMGQTAQTGAPSGSGLFGAFSEGTTSPYVPGGYSSTGVGKGDIHDDEVPF